MLKRALTTLPLTLTLVAAACGTAASTPSPTPSTSASTPSASATPGAIATATATPTASPRPQSRTPEPVAPTNTSDLVARLDFFGETCCPVPVAVITADGRVVTTTETGAYVERRITAAAAQRVRSELLASGLFTKDQGLPAEPMPGAVPGPLPIAGYNLRVWNGSALVRLQWVTIPPDRAASYRPSPARARGSDRDTAPCSGAVASRGRLDERVAATVRRQRVPPHSHRRPRGRLTACDRREHLAVHYVAARVRGPPERAAAHPHGSRGCALPPLDIGRPASGPQRARACGCDAVRRPAALRVLHRRGVRPIRYRHTALRGTALAGPAELHGRLLAAFARCTTQ